MYACPQCTIAERHVHERSRPAVGRLGIDSCSPRAAASSRHIRVAVRFRRGAEGGGSEVDEGVRRRLGLHGHDPRPSVGGLRGPQLSRGLPWGQQYPFSSPSHSTRVQTLSSRPSFPSVSSRRYGTDHYRQPRHSHRRRRHPRSSNTPASHPCLCYWSRSRRHRGCGRSPLVLIRRAWLAAELRCASLRLSPPSANGNVAVWPAAAQTSRRSADGVAL